MTRNWITEYGMVYTNDTREVRDKRWFKTVNLLFMHVDGNQAHRLNGGHENMARNNCIGAMANHAGSDSNAEYFLPTNTATPRAIIESTGEQTKWQCVILRASENIYPNQQILADYEPKTASALWISFRNEPLFSFLRNVWAAYRTSTVYAMA